MYFCLVVTLLVAGVATSWLAASRPFPRPFAAAAMEKASGALLVAALSLLGLALPAARYIVGGHGAAVHATTPSSAVSETR